MLTTTRPEPGAKLRDEGFDQLADHVRDNHPELSRNMRRKIVETIRRVFKPRPKMTVDQCADAFRYIPKEASADYGKYRVGTYAVAFGPLRAVTEKGVQVITISASTQLMKTSFLECVTLYFMIVDPSPMILLQPTKNLAKVFSTRKIDPLINHTPKAREVLIKATTAMKIFFGGDLMIVTAASENDLKMVPRRICMSDEVETIEDHEGGDAVALAEARIESYGDRALACRVSSPRMKDGPIEKSYRDGDMRLPFVRCPNPECRHEQVMRWSRNKDLRDEKNRLVRWNEDPVSGRWDARSIRYHCVECGHPFTEGERQAAITDVRWKQTRGFTCCPDHAEDGGGFQLPEQTRSWVDYFHESDGRHVVSYATCQVCGKQGVSNEHASFGRASRLYSPKRLTKLVRLWRDALQSSSKFQTFVNNELAEPYEPEETGDWSVDGLTARLEKFDFVVPSRVSGLVCGVDVQETWVEVTVLGVGRQNETWVIAHHRIEGDFNNRAVQDRLDEVLLRTEYVGVNGRPFRIEQTFVDSGYKTTSVYRYCKAREQHRIFASKGWNESKNIHPVHPHNFRIAGTVKAKLFMIGTNNAKADFFSFLSRALPGPGFVHFDRERVDDQFLNGLLTERRHRVPGGFVYKVKHDGVRNEPLDTWCLAYAAAEGLRQAHRDVLLFDRWADEQGIGREMTESEQRRFDREARKVLDDANKAVFKKLAPKGPLKMPQVATPTPAAEIDQAAGTEVAQPDTQPIPSVPSGRQADRREGSSLPSRFPQIARRSGNRGGGSPF